MEKLVACIAQVWLWPILPHKQSVPILDFWGPYAKLCLCVWGGGGGGVWGMDETHLSMFHSVSNRARETVSLCGTLSTHFFFLKQEDCTTFTLQDFYIESVTAHRIKRNDRSCFHISWPNSKSKLKLKHLWEQGCFGGPMQPAYSAYREDRLCKQSSHLEGSVGLIWTLIFSSYFLLDWSQVGHSSSFIFFLWNQSRVSLYLGSLSCWNVHPCFIFIILVL